MERFVVIMGLYYATATVPLAAQEAAAGKRTPEVTNELRNELPSGATPRRSSCKGKDRMRGGGLEPEAPLEMIAESPGWTSTSSARASFTRVEIERLLFPRRMSETCPLEPRRGIDRRGAPGDAVQAAARLPPSASVWLVRV